MKLRGVVLGLLVLVPLLPGVSALTITKLSNPSSLPATEGDSVAFSPDGKFLAVGAAGSPYINIYQISGTTYTKLANPATLPAGPVIAGVSFSADGKFLALAQNASPYVIIYSISGSTFTKLADPASLPAGNSLGVAFSKDSSLLAIAHATSPYLTIYSVSGSTFTKLADPPAVPGSTGRGVAFSPDGKYLAWTGDSSGLVVYAITAGPTFTKITDPATMPAGNGQSVSFSADSALLAVGHSTTPFISIYTTGATFVKTSNPGSLPGNSGFGVAFSPDGGYLAVAESATPYVILYAVAGSTSSGWTFTRTTDPTAAVSFGTGVAWSPSSNAFAISTTGSPFVAIYSTDIVFNPSASAPTAPAGLSAQVTQIQTNPTGDKIELRWLLSSTDPDQNVGAFEYHIFINGADTITDTTTSADGSGQRFNLLNINTAAFAPQTFVFWVEAKNGVQISGPSCSITINDGALNFKACGLPVAGAAAAVSPIGATDVGGGLKTFTANLLGSSGGSLFFGGLVFVVLAFLAVAAAFAAVTHTMGTANALAGMVGGLGMSLFNAIAGIWDIWVEGVFILLAAGVTSFFVRKMFFGGAEDGK